MVTDIRDNATYPRLARVANEIKECYATARMLLFEACSPPPEIDMYEGMTRYADNLDYAVYGIQPGKLKAAFQGGFNVLDKMSLFLNDYLKLGLDPRGVSFSTIWAKGKGNMLRTPIAEKHSLSLFALYDVSQDFGLHGYYSRLRDIRNRLAHRYLVPHMEGVAHWELDADEAGYHVEYDEFAKRTIELLQIVRCAIIYLIAFLEVEFRKARSARKGIVAPLHVPRFRSFRIRPLGRNP